MAVLRSDIERALDELISNEGGMAFQGLAVVLGKLRWPELIAQERHKDFGLDAYAGAGITPEQVGKGLASSITPTLKKISEDATKAKAKFTDLGILLFVTPVNVGNKNRIDWTDEIRKTHGLDLHTISREDIISTLMMPKNLSLCSSFLGIPIAIEAAEGEVIERIRRAASEETANWATKLKGQPLIRLSSVRLNQGGAESEDTLSFADILDALSKGRRVVLEAPAGRGKTTTLIELAQQLLASGQSAFVIDLPAWTSSGEGILEHVAGMSSFQAQRIDTQALARAQNGEHFCFLLNGWNEIAESGSLQALNKLRELERSFPSAGIIVATRTHHSMPPLPGAVRARLRALTRPQRAAYLSARLDERAAALRQQLDADPVLDELTRTPFILSEVVSLFEQGASIPATKMGVLAAVISLLEEAREHKNELQVAPLSGRQLDYLCALATEMTRQGGVVLADAAARAVVRAVGQDLVERGQIAGIPDPATILVTLTAHHVLERVDYPAVAFRFEHQQFQEHYAAVGIREKLIELTDANSDSQHRFVADYVNDPVWAEPLRMIAETLGGQTGDERRQLQNIRAGRLLVEMALSVDPLFAAEVSALCGGGVWKEVGGSLGVRLREWYAVHDENHQQCALAAMLASGSSDFRDIVIPLVSAGDEQTRLRTYRLWPDFQMSTLGVDWQARVRGWSEEARADFVSEVLRSRLVPEMVAFVVADPSMKVKKAAVSSLGWTGAVDDAALVLESMDDDTFSQAARELSRERLPVGLRPRVVAAIHRVLDTAGDPWDRLRAVSGLIELGEPALDERLKRALDDIPTDEVQKHGHYLIRPTLERLRQRDPGWVSEWVASRIVDGGLWPEHWIGFVTDVPGELAEKALQRLENENFNHKPFGGTIAVLKVAADEKLAARVFERIRNLRRVILAAPDQNHEFEWAIERQLKALFQAMPVDIAIAGLLVSLCDPPEAYDVQVATRLLSRVARSDLDPITGLDGALKTRIRDYLKRSVGVVLAAEDFNGAQKAHLASSLAQVGEPEDMADLVTLMRADIERMKQGHAALAAGDHGPRANGATMSYASWHLSAAVHLDSVGVVPVLIDFLPEPEYTQAVAETIARSALTIDKPLLDQNSRFRQIWDAREGRLKPSARAADYRRYADALAVLIERMLEDRKRDEHAGSGYTLMRLANALAAVGGAEFAGPVLNVIYLFGIGEDWQRVEAAERLLSMGVVLPAAKTVELLDAVLDRHQKYGLQDQDRWLIKRYMNLLPFTDDPAEGVRQLRDRLPRVRFAAYEHRDIVPALGESRCDSALDLLRDLAADPKVLKHFEEPWINAVARLDTPAARELLLSFVDPEIRGLAAGIEMQWPDVLSFRIADLAKRFPEIERRLRQLTERDLPPVKRLRLAATLNVIGTPETLMSGLALIDDRAQPSIPRDTFVNIEAAFVERRPQGQASNTYVLAARAANVVRAALFEMVTRDDRRKKSAFALLGQIEQWRLEYGRPTGEPRHPAIRSGQPWPPNEPVA